ncbi:hypothetical protein MGN70_014274 [Eutypa lata]|nr:hypothetical protein MGN70_014274 [Eutypa lata]
MGLLLLATAQPFAAGIPQQVLPNSSRCLESREYLAPFSPDLLRPGAPVVRTVDKMQALTRRYKGDVRLEEVEGAAVFIQLSTTTHIGTIEGSALEFVQRSLERHSAEQRGGEGGTAPSPRSRSPLDPRDGTNCVVVRNCPKECLLLI